MNIKYLLDNMIFSESMGTEFFPGFYHRKICPGFWEFLNNGNLATIQFIIEKESKLQLEEICPNLKVINEKKHQETYEKLVNQVHECSKYLEKSIFKFFKSADPWLIATAKDLGLTIITQETSKTYNNNKMGVKIPNVCEDFQVRCVRLQNMLVQENIEFYLKRT